MPVLTSLKVSPEVRERFATVAKARGLTVRALLDELSRQAVDATLMQQVGRQMSELREKDPAAWTDYLTDGQSWEENTVEQLDA